MSNNNFALILTCTIKPIDIPNLVRADYKTRLSDYKKSFNFWINNPCVKKIIFIENSNFDIEYFKQLAKNSTTEVEFLSNDLNNSFDKKLGKGFGQYLCFREIFEKSNIAKKTEYFFNVTGRHIIKNFEQIFNDFSKQNNDIYINLSDNLKFCNTTNFGASKKFLKDYFLKEAIKTSDEESNILERRMAIAVLKGVSEGLILSKTPIYADLDGYIGTNGKRLNFNFFKKAKLYYFRKLKSYFFNHKKY